MSGFYKFRPKKRREVPAGTPKNFYGLPEVGVYKTIEYIATEVQDEMDYASGVSKTLASDLDDDLSKTRRKRIMADTRRTLNWRRFIKKRLEKYGPKWAKNKAKRQEDSKAFLEKVTNNPDWFFYHSINYWIEKKHLQNDGIRLAIPPIMNNPSYSDKQKREAIDFLLKLDVIGKHVDPKIAPDELPRVARKGTPDTAADPEQLPKFPKTYNELVALAENNILPEEIPRRYFPPEGKPKYTKNEY